MPPAKSFAPRAFAGVSSIDADIMRRPYRAFAAKGTGERADAIPIERPSPEFREGRWQPRRAGSQLHCTEQGREGSTCQANVMTHGLLIRPSLPAAAGAALLAHSWCRIRD